MSIESKVTTVVILEPLITKDVDVVITPNKSWEYNVLSHQGAIRLSNYHYQQFKEFLKIGNGDIIFKYLFDYCFETKFTSCSSDIIKDVKMLLPLFQKSYILSYLLNKQDEMYKKLFEMWAIVNKDCKLKVLEMSHPTGKCMDSQDSRVDHCIFCKLQCDFEIAKANQYIINSNK